MKEFLEELNESGEQVHNPQMVINRLNRWFYSRKIIGDEYDLNSPENIKLNVMKDAIISTIIKVSTYSAIDHNELKDILLTNIVNELVD